MARTIDDAKNKKKDEFYTQLTDIEKELKFYKTFFKEKIIYCNCDNPYKSNFVRYFIRNFNAFRLKKLIATCYNEDITIRTESTIDFEKKGERTQTHALKVEITTVNETLNIEGEFNLKHFFQNNKNTVSLLKGNGDFRSSECIEILKESDIIITNPPFSLFREFVSLLMKHSKKFIILGNINAVTYKEIFPLIKSNKIWFGPSISSGDRLFNVPDYYEIRASKCGIDEKGRKYIRVKGVRWFTNLSHVKRHFKLDLVLSFSQKKYLQYDNYDAININKTQEIPYDYKGVMGVPITFLDKYNPEQFEIIGFRKGIDNKDLRINGKCPYFRILIRKL
jgi:hypothetical protein